MKEPKTYRDITWTTDAELSRKLGRSNTYVGMYKRKGKTYEEIIDYVLNKYADKEYRDIKWRTNRELSRRLCENDDYVSSKIREGKTYEEIIDHVFSRSNMSSYRDITWFDIEHLSTQLKRLSGYEHIMTPLSRCMTYHEIIDMVLDMKDIPGEYHGITWTTDEELSIKLKRKPSYVRNRRYSGFTYEEIINDILGLPELPGEYRGISWTTDEELSIKLKRKPSYVKKLRKGRKFNKYKEIIDYALYIDERPGEYRGISWNTDRELFMELRRYNKFIYNHDDFVYRRRHNHQTYEEIIDSVIDCKEFEYRGISWNIDEELSIKLGKPYNYVMFRRKRGMSYEEIIDGVLNNK